MDLLKSDMFNFFFINFSIQYNITPSPPPRVIPNPPLKFTLNLGLLGNLLNIILGQERSENHV